MKRASSSAGVLGMDAPAALAKALEVPCNPAVEVCGIEAIELTNKVVVGNIAGAAGSQALYSIEVPAGAKRLNVMSYGGTGNVGMYVSAGEAPSVQSYDYKSVRPGNTETVRANKPVATTYYILLVGDGAFSGVSLQARID
ncbi:MAG: PPC domain-containing protein [Lysobacter sp.]